MHRYIAKRLFLLVPVILGVTLLVFALMHLAPGDAASALMGEFGQGASAENIQQLRTSLGLDQPLYVQYGRYLAGVVRGDFGVSVRSRRPVTAEIMERFPYTLQLTLASLCLAVAIALPIGVLAAVRHNTGTDLGVMFGALLGVSMPSFWLGLLLMLLFSLTLGWLPASGSGSIKHLILPAVTIAWPSMAFIARMTRSAMLDVLGQDYIRTARAKGLPSVIVVFRHALRNALIPIVTTVGLQFGSLLGGAVLTETIFAWPGIGRLTVQAIQARDLPMVQGTVLFVALLYTGVNLAVDLLYVCLNPKIRYD